MKTIKDLKIGDTVAVIREHTHPMRIEYLKINNIIKEKSGWDGSVYHNMWLENHMLWSFDGDESVLQRKGMKLYVDPEKAKNNALKMLQDNIEKIKTEYDGLKQTTQI